MSTQTQTIPVQLASLDDLRAFVHRTLCEKENLLADQYQLLETPLVRSGRKCGLQFLLRGLRAMWMAAVWAADQNVIYFYDCRGDRYLKARLPQPLNWDRSAA